ncbi:hypothetical protein APHAL10511_000813 [Amanita phalloides]|nr:hypothetical protein APHAL10511_000813 [Amanita phalloides]
MSVPTGNPTNPNTPPDRPVTPISAESEPAGTPGEVLENQNAVHGTAAPFGLNDQDTQTHNTSNDLASYRGLHCDCGETIRNEADKARHLATAWWHVGRRFRCPSCGALHGLKFLLKMHRNASQHWD